MNRIISLLVFCVSLNAFSSNWVDRPMILPKKAAQTDLVVGVTQAQAGNVSGTGEAVAFGVDAGFGNKLQGGLLVSFPVAPNPDFGTFILNLQYGLNATTNGRVDFGADNISVALSSGGFPTTADTTMSFTFGLGLPSKWKLGPNLAVVSGKTTALSFANPMHLTYSNAGTTSSLFGLGPLFSNDNISLISSSLGTFGMVALPIGILFQPHDKVSFSMRTGFRFAYTYPDAAADDHAYYLPIGFDVLLNLMPKLDLAFMVELPGRVGGGSNSTATLGDGYADLIQMNFGFQVRL